MVPLLDNLRDSPDRAAALASCSRLAPRYDASCGWLDGVRFEVLELLAASEGETVIDVACGSGAMLPALARVVGRCGRVISIEQRPEMAALARERTGRAGLDNVRIVVAPVEEAQVETIADTVLFFYTHDVLQSRMAVERVLVLATPVVLWGCSPHLVRGCNGDRHARAPWRAARNSPKTARRSLTRCLSRS